MDARVEVLIVEDSEEFADRLFKMICGEPGLVVSGYATSSAEAIESIARQRPDLILLDLHLREGYGTTVLRMAKALNEPITVIVVSGEDSQIVRAHCEELGADGFVAKCEAGSRLLPAIRDVLTRRSRRD